MDKKIEIIYLSEQAYIAVDGAQTNGRRYINIDGKKIIPRSSPKYSNQYQRQCYLLYQRVQTLKHSEKRSVSRKLYKKENEETIKQKNKIYSIQNKQKISKYKKEYAKNNQQKIRQKGKQNRSKNSEQIRKKKKEYYNKPDVKVAKKQYDRNYAIQNKEKISEYRKEYQRNRLIADPIYRYLKNIRTRVSRAFSDGNLKKRKSSLQFMGCSPQEFCLYISYMLKDGMTFQNYGKVWHLDHRIPLSFAYTQLTEQLKIKKLQELCYYLNYQPLFAQENLKKSDIVPE